jgi:hypothetical protein
MNQKKIIERLGDLSNYVYLSVDAIEDEECDSEEGIQQELVIIRSNALEMAQLAEILLKGTRYEVRDVDHVRGKSLRMS